MKKILLASIAIGLAGNITGCQSTNLHTMHTFNDPVVVHGYQLPVFPDGIEIKTSYRQQRNLQTWFWSVLENQTYQSGENYIVQIVSNQPLAQPPAHFAFSLPQYQGEKTYNAIGPYTRWIIPEPSGESCVYAQQYTRKDNNWLSLFVHFCTPEAKTENIAWLDEIKPSFYLEGL
ncbi:hypothetical protein [uncultured Photobacterium sp.]|uniref:hypothetical protein n=1 Tax=uncultured Photobacterium sp. TaxID=173973 RepID=UPI002606C96C|nr:hypothetical protein [uncultured Photobacterium sp.]